MFEVVRYEPHPSGNGVVPYRHQLHNLQIPGDGRLAHTLDAGELRTVLMRLGVEGVTASTGQQDCLLQLSRHLRLREVAQ